MMKKLIFTIACFFVGMNANASQSGIYEDWEAFAQKKIEDVPQKLSSIVVVRDKSLEGTAINIYIDGEYQTSLLPGAYTQTMVCPGVHYLEPAYTNVMSGYKEKRIKSSKSVLSAGKVHYFKVIADAQNRLQLQPLSASQSRDVAKEYTTKQTHTISRFNKKECSE